MSCGLDASTRIYACRVDNVHAGVMEIVTGLAGADKHKKKKSKDLNNSLDGQDKDDDDDEEDGEIHSRRSKRRKVIH